MSSTNPQSTPKGERPTWRACVWIALIVVLTLVAIELYHTPLGPWLLVYLGLAALFASYSYLMRYLVHD